MFQRLNPDVGYVDPADMSELGLTQVVAANGFLFMSGIAPMRGSLAELEVVAPGDMAGQLEYLLEILDRCLIACGSSREHLISWNLYATDLDALSAHGEIMKAWAGNHVPASTGVQVEKLFLEGQVLELQAVAIQSSAVTP
jgi:enamine deaminase RidA (YjgF/YER057c/UK114 family)